MCCRQTNNCFLTSELHYTKTFLGEKERKQYSNITFLEISICPFGRSDAVSKVFSLRLVHSPVSIGEWTVGGAWPEDFRHKKSAAPTSFTASDFSFLPSVVLNPDNIYSPNAWAQYIVTGCNSIHFISPKFFKTSYWHIRVTLPQHLMRPLSLSGQPPVCFGMLHMLTSQRKPRGKNTILASPVMFVVFFSNPVRSWWKW